MSGSLKHEHAVDEDLLARLRGLSDEELAAETQGSEEEAVSESQPTQASEDSSEDDTVESNIVALSLPKGETRH